MLPAPLNTLLSFLNRFPGVGPKTALRYLYWLLALPKEEVRNLTTLLQNLEAKINHCENCFSLSLTNPCDICANLKRNKKIICVVAKTQDITVIEQTGEFQGVYHVLGGLLNHIENIGPEQLKIKELLDKTKTSEPKTEEIILALNPDMNGETTMGYLTRALLSSKVRVTRLARGLPVGADLEYADPITLTDALKRRHLI